MQQAELVQTRKSKWPALGCLVVGLSLAGACQPHNTVIVKQQRRAKSEAVAVAQGQLVAASQRGPALSDPDYQLVGDMATLSAYVYAGEKPANQRPDYHGRNAPEYRPDSVALGRRHWRPFVFRYRLEPPARQKMLGGLVYDVWVQAQAGQPSLAALVFRGTDDGPDWPANLRPVPGMNTRRRWDQYEQVRALTPVLVAKLDSAYGKKLRIFATGHSLGGGLAQHACYTSPRVEKVFAFNATPLTGYYDFAEDERPHLTNGRRIYRIYESNEVLAGLRFFTAPFRNFPEASDIVLVRYNFSPALGGSRGIYQHSIQRLAASLRGDK